MADASLLVELMRVAGTGLVAGGFAAFIAIKDHRFKKWWELRVAAYQSVIDALSDLVYVHEILYRAELEQRDLPEPREEELGKTARDSYARVRKAADAGAFLFSAETNRALRDVRLEWDNRDHNMYIEHVEGILYAAKKCLDTVVTLSKVDLQLKAHFFVWK